MRIAKCDLVQDKNAPQCQTGFWLSPLSQMVFLIVNNLLFLTILLSSFKYSSNLYFQINLVYFAIRNF